MSQTDTNITTWNINGFSFELDLQDVESVERYEEAFDKMGEEEKKIPQDGKTSAHLKAYCTMFRHLFDNLFGEGSANKILGEKDNTRVATEAYESFLAFAAAQQTPIIEAQNRIMNRYSPNRAQRREAARNK